MDLSRRAPNPTPTAEARRIADLYRPITTANYGTARPIVIGQQRCPSTILRDGRKAAALRPWIPADEQWKALYGLCEAPVASIPREISNETGQTNPGFQPDVAAHVTYPLAYVAVAPPTSADEALPDRSYEVSSDIPLAGTGIGAYISTGSHQHQAADGTAAFNEDASKLPASLVSDFHCCYTGSGATLARWMVVYNRAANSITVYMNPLGGQGGDGQYLICDGTVNNALRPQAGAMVQPRIAAVGDTVHVVWSVLDNAGSPVQVAHVWTANGGAAWTVGQSLSLAAKGDTTGVWRLGVHLHSSGELWVCFQRRSESTSASSNPFPSKGVVVGFLPSTATGATAWILPTANPTGTSIEHLADFELLLLQFTVARPLDFGQPDRLRGPSIMPLGSGKALLSAVYMSRNGAIQCPLIVFPIIATTEVAWDFPAGAFAVPGEGSLAHNVANFNWVQSNGFPTQLLDHTPSADYDKLNDGSTQLVDLGGGAFGVLVLKRRDNWNGYNPTPEAENHAMGGLWSFTQGTWNGTAFAWTLLFSSAWQDTGFLAHAFYNGNGQVYIAMGKRDDEGSPVGDTDAVDYRARRLSMVMLTPGLPSAKQVWTYAPATQLNNSLMYQIWAGNATALVSVRENEDLFANYTVGIREVTQFDGKGDVLPSVICQRLLSADPRGLGIKGLVFDSVTWGVFDNYCRAMGIKFSLVLTSQQAAWPLVCDILESANAIPYRSEGMLKVAVRETASLTANGATYTPIWDSGVVIDPRDLRDGVTMEVPSMEEEWNSLRVTWKNRARAYADEPYQIEDAGSVARRGRIPASAVDWPWICDGQVAAVCAWLRLSRQRRGVVYRFALPQKYMLHEVADIVTISFPGVLSARKVRLLSMEEEDGDWIECTAEDAPDAGAVIRPPRGGSAASGGTILTPTPINLPILFVALIGGLLQVWCLLSWAPSGSGCAVWQSWDGSNWAQVGACTTPSPTGHLVQDMARLRVQPGLRCRPGLRVGVADFATADYSECSLVPPVPTWTGFQAGEPGSLLWVNGELMAYALESHAGSIASCSMLRRGLYGTAIGKHPILARVGAVTSSAWTMPVPPGREGQTCYFRFPAPGESLAVVPTYSVEIPA